MRTTLAAQAHHQSGLVTRNQALRCHYTERELRTLTRPDGPWATVRRGVYVDRRSWDALDEPERHRLRVRAVFLNGAQPLVASHTSAAALHGLDLLRETTRLLHMSAPGITGGRTEHGVKYHPAGVPPRDVVETAYGWATGQARTSADVAREYGYVAGLVVADQVLRRGVPQDELARVLADMRCWPRVTRARAALADADSGAETVGETLLRAMVLELGLGRPRTQHRVEQDGRVALVDLRLGCHLFEFDGRLKYRRERPWSDGRSVEQVLWQEKRREDWLRSVTGYGVSRVVWSECLGLERARTVARLRDEVQATVRRVGLKAWTDALD